MDIFGKFEECEPSIWVNTLTNERISEAEYKHANKVWHDLEMKNLGQYHDICLRADV